MKVTGMKNNKTPGPGFEPGWSYDHRISSPTPYQAGPSRHNKTRYKIILFKVIYKLIHHI